MAMVADTREEEPVHILAQYEALRNASMQRVEEMKEKVAREKRQLALRDEEEKRKVLDISVGAFGSDAGGSPPRAAAEAAPAAHTPLDEQEKLLRFRERALEDRVLERRRGELERLKALEEKERAIRTRGVEQNLILGERERELDDKLQQQKTLLQQQTDTNARLRRELDERSVQLEELDRDLTQRARQVLLREAELIARGQELEARERTVNVKEKDVEDRMKSIHGTEQSERDRARAIDEAERELVLSSEKTKKDLADRWKLLEESIHLFEQKQSDEQLHLKRLKRELDERLSKVDKAEAELRMRETQVEEQRMNLTQRELRLNDIEQRAIDRLKRELGEREANQKATFSLPVPVVNHHPSHTTDLFTPKKITLQALAHPSPPSNAYAGSHTVFQAQSQSPTELSPDSAIGDPK